MGILKAVFIKLSGPNISDPNFINEGELLGAYKIILLLVTVELDLCCCPQKWSLNTQKTRKSFRDASS